MVSISVCVFLNWKGKKWRISRFLPNNGKKTNKKQIGTESRTYAHVPICELHTYSWRRKQNVLIVQKTNNLEWKFFFEEKKERAR